jgi:hypothetical protein
MSGAVKAADSSHGDEVQSCQRLDFVEMIDDLIGVVHDFHERRPEWRITRFDAAFSMLPLDTPMTKSLTIANSLEIAEVETWLVGIDGQSLAQTWPRATLSAFGYALLLVLAMELGNGAQLKTRAQDSNEDTMYELSLGVALNADGQWQMRPVQKRKWQGDHSLVLHVAAVENVSIDKEQKRGSRRGS